MAAGEGIEPSIYDRQQRNAFACFATLQLFF